MKKNLFFSSLVFLFLFSCVSRKRLRMEEGSFVFINRNHDMKEEFHIVTDSIVNSLDLRGSYKRKHKRLNRVGKHKNIRIEVNIKALIQDSINNNGIYYYQTELIDFPHRAVHVRGLSILSYRILVKINNQVYFHPEGGYMKYKAKLIEKFGDKEIQKFESELEKGIIFF
jgi:hypothetical protein